LYYIQTLVLLGLITVGNWWTIFRNYDFENVKAAFFCASINKVQTKHVVGVDVYIHVFLTTALGTDVPLTSDSYLAAYRNTVTYDYEAWCESENGGTGQGKVLRPI
jgi:hypothetical protein